MADRPRRTEKVMLAISILFSGTVYAQDVVPDLLRCPIRIM